MLTEEGREEPNHTTARKPGPLYIIQYALLSSERAQGGLFVLEHLHIITAAYHFVIKIGQRMKYFHAHNIDKRQAVAHMMLL
jgi:hypothetical protein